MYSKYYRCNKTIDQSTEDLWSYTRMHFDLSSPITANDQQELPQVNKIQVIPTE